MFTFLFVFVFVFVLVFIICICICIGHQQDERVLFEETSVGARVVSCHSCLQLRIGSVTNAPVGSWPRLHQSVNSSRSLTALVFFFGWAWTRVAVGASWLDAEGEAVTCFRLSLWRGPSTMAPRLKVQSLYKYKRPIKQGKVHMLFTILDKNCQIWSRCESFKASGTAAIGLKAEFSNLVFF